MLVEVDSFGLLNGHGVTPVPRPTGPQLRDWDSDIPQAPHDSILHITELFRADPHTPKLNLGVGAYRTEEGTPLVLSVVKHAETQLVGEVLRYKEYLPVDGNHQFCECSRQLAFGADSAALKKRLVTTEQSLSGTGALRLGAEFVSLHYPIKTVYMSNPSWAGHTPIFAPTGMKLLQYRYFDPLTKGLDFEGMLEDLEEAEEGAVVLLHACAHNPTGVDPTPEQWRSILTVVKQRCLLPFMDMAYQGFASGDLDADAFSVRLFADSGVRMLLAQSYSKNLGLYGERTGALSVLCGSPDAKLRVESQLKLIIRAMYSSPPQHGAAIAAEVMSNPRLLAEWKEELHGMSQRIVAMRQGLYAALVEEGAPGDWSFVLRQIGMFSYTGMTSEQCEYLASHWHVYMTLDGRMSMAGLSSKTCGYLAQAIVDAIKACPSIPVEQLSPMQRRQSMTLENAGGTVEI